MNLITPHIDREEQFNPSWTMHFGKFFIESTVPPNGNVLYLPISQCNYPTRYSYKMGLVKYYGFSIDIFKCIKKAYFPFYVLERIDGVVNNPTFRWVEIYNPSMKLVLSDNSFWTLGYNDNK